MSREDGLYEAFLYYYLSKEVKMPFLLPFWKIVITNKILEMPWDMILKLTGLLFRPRKVAFCQFRFQTLVLRGLKRDPCWELVSNLALWFVWRERCAESLRGESSLLQRLFEIFGWSFFTHFIASSTDSNVSQISGYSNEKLFFDFTEQAHSSISTGAVCWHY